jgi:fluoride exporter
MMVGEVAAAGAIGAVLRYVIDRSIQSRMTAGFPFGILVINVSGSLFLGTLTGSALHHGLSSVWATVIGSGFVGSYTTFSTFTFDTYRMLTGDEPRKALANVAITLMAGLGAAAGGLAIGSLT